jgi:uncharacterized protein (UPF0333 family)
MKTRRAQGTIEYLVIIAIVVVIALVVVGLLLQVLGSSGSGIPETTAKSSWKSAEPWAITDWTNSAARGLTVVIKNNSYESLGFNSIKVRNGTVPGQDLNNLSATIPPGGTKVLDLNLQGDGTDYRCTSGSKYAITKDNIVIDYNTTNISGKTELGIADLVGTCTS